MDMDARLALDRDEDRRTTTGLAHDPGQAFASVVELALAHLACDDVGVAMRDSEGAAVTLAASGPMVEEADTLQTRHADGPAVSPAWSSPQEAVADLEDDHLWPTWTRSLGDLGVRRILATQIITPEGLTGSLTLYYSRPAEPRGDAFTAHDLTLTRVLASYAGTQLAQAALVSQLRTAVESRTGIGQAQGILMERFGITPDRAFDVLRRHSQDTNTKLSEVASTLVSTRTLDSYPVLDHSRRDR